MTESDWLTCRAPTTMLEVLRGKASDRKLRLLVVASYGEMFAKSPGMPDYQIYGDSIVNWDPPHALLITQEDKKRKRRF